MIKQASETRASNLDGGVSGIQLMREVQVNYFWHVYKLTNHSIEKTAELLGIGRAGVYRYLAGAYDKQIQTKKRMRGVK